MTRHTVQDPEWLDEDIDAALEYQDYLASLCSGCGHPRDESFNPDLQFEWYGEALTCHACAERDRTAESKRSNKNHDCSGEFYVVHRR